MGGVENVPTRLTSPEPERGRSVPERNYRSGADWRRPTDTCRTERLVV